MGSFSRCPYIITANKSVLKPKITHCHYIIIFAEKNAILLAKVFCKAEGSHRTRDIQVIQKARSAVWRTLWSRDTTQQQAEQIVRNRAMSDFVADSLETMFTRGDITTELARLRQTDKGLFNEIRKFIGKWINKIKEFYSSRTITQEGDIVAHLESFEKVQRMFAEALVDAGENYRTTMENAVETNA